MSFERVQADWPAPPGVHAFTTTRAGGVSRGPWRAFNLGAAGGDDAGAVAENRRRLRQALPAAPAWLRQVHGTAVFDADLAVAAHDGGAAGGAPPEADAAVTRAAGRVLAVLTADCVPVALCDRAGSVVGVAHAGWRGLAAGVLEAAVAALGARPGDVLAWLGPAIGPRHFEVGGEVRDAFLRHDAGAAGAFQAHGGKWLADLWALCRRRLAAAGVGAVHGGGHCSYADDARFYSYRRDGETGRMATVIWRD